MSFLVLMLGVSSWLPSADAYPRARHAAPLYGVTVDDVGLVQAVLPSLGALPERPTVRLYIDPHVPLRSDLQAVRLLSHRGSVMVELLDSSDERSVSPTLFGHRVRRVVKALYRWTSVFEVGNEVNGSWTGPRAAVRKRLEEALAAVRAVHRPAALTLYENNFGPNHCGDGPGELTPAQFSASVLPARVRREISYLLISYYPAECGGRLPSHSELARAFSPLSRLYPEARYGFGEVGLPSAATAATASSARRLMHWAYSLKAPVPRWIGGYFWWYGAEDCLVRTGRLRMALRAAFAAERSALG